MPQTSFGFAGISSVSNSGREGNGDGLFGLAAEARMKAIASVILGRRRPDATSAEPRSSLLISRIMIESVRGPTRVVGGRLSGKSRILGISAGAFSGAIWIQEIEGDYQLRCRSVGKDR